MINRIPNLREKKEMLKETEKNFLMILKNIKQHSSMKNKQSENKYFLKIKNKVSDLQNNSQTKNGLSHVEFE